MKNEKIKIVVLRPQARLGAQPPKAALSAERKHGCAVQKISALWFLDGFVGWGLDLCAKSRRVAAALRPEIERPPYNTKQTPHNP